MNNDKPLGPGAITANINYYTSKEQEFNIQAVAARQQKEHWEQMLKELQQ